MRRSRTRLPTCASIGLGRRELLPPGLGSESSSRAMVKSTHLVNESSADTFSREGLSPDLRVQARFGKQRQPIVPQCGTKTGPNLLYLNPNNKLFSSCGLVNICPS